MSTATSHNHPITSSSNRHGININAGIDSSLTDDPARRGSLTPSELDTIHQTKSFQEAIRIQEEDERELAAKTKKVQRAKDQAQK